MRSMQEGLYRTIPLICDHHEKKLLQNLFLGLHYEFYFILFVLLLDESHYYTPHVGVIDIKIKVTSSKITFLGFFRLLLEMNFLNLIFAQEKKILVNFNGINKKTKKETGENCLICSCCVQTFNILNHKSRNYSLVFLIQSLLCLLVLTDLLLQNEWTVFRPNWLNVFNFFVT